MNLICPYCQRNMDCSRTFPSSSAANYECSVCRYSIQVEKDKIIFGWFECRDGNEEYKITFNFLAKLTRLYKGVAPVKTNINGKDKPYYQSILELPHILNISPYDATFKIKTLLNFQ